MSVSNYVLNETIISENKSVRRSIEKFDDMYSFIYELKKTDTDEVIEFMSIGLSILFNRKHSISLRKDERGITKQYSLSQGTYITQYTNEYLVNHINCLIENKLLRHKFSDKLIEYKCINDGIYILFVE